MEKLVPILILWIGFIRDTRKDRCKVFFVGTESQKAVINILKRIATEENDQTSLKLSSVYEKASDIAVLLNKEFNFSKKWEGASDDDINHALLYLTLVETGIKQFLEGQN